MTQNTMYGLLGVMVLALMLLVGYLIYQQQTQPRLELKVDSHGIQVTGNG